MKQLMSGNEAIARGAFEADVKLASAYPGTPSTEILETIARDYRSVYAQWSPNEKVAYEVAIGASMGGARAMVTMKHVGLNVAADPFMTHSYTGVNGGFVIVCADDPEMHSSQNEQDNRHYAKFAQVPMLEPSDSAEARAMLLAGYEISEQFDTPVMLRLTTRISHAKTVVEVGEQMRTQQKKFAKDPSKYVMIPAYARGRHEVVQKRLAELQQFTEQSPYNYIENSGSEIGIITGGIAYQYAKEVAPDLDYLKLGLSFPLPMKMIGEFIKSHDKVIVVEELEPFYEDQIRAAGFMVEGKKFFGHLGEYSPHRVAQGLKDAGVLTEIPISAKSPATKLFPRPPVLCPGCPHRGMFMALKKLKLTVAGDIGCYTLGALPPLQALDSCICMGASIGNAIGMGRVDGSESGVVAVIGDSTFLHSGITGLLDATFNKSNVTVIILDNSTTAMTGGQEHPGTGRTLMGDAAGKVDIPELCRALGISRVREVDAYDYEACMSAIKDETAAEEPSVLITSRPCVLMPQRIMDEPYVVDLEYCNGCSACFRISCPAIAASDETNDHGHPKAVIDESLCTGCTLCAQICPEEAIVLKSQMGKAQV